MTLPKQIEEALISGDLSSLTSEQKIAYKNSVCESLGLNPATNPLEYILVPAPHGEGKRLTLYAKKDCTEQLRYSRKISLAISARETFDDVFSVTARATDPSGRTDESIGVVSLVKPEWAWNDAKKKRLPTGKILPLVGDEKANALMKAETKAKRRVTLSICGLGILDESELESIRGVVRQELDVTPVVKPQAPMAPTEPYKGPIQAHAETIPPKPVTPVKLEEDELPDWLSDPVEGSIDDLNALDTQKIRESLEAQALEPVAPTNPGDFTFQYGYYQQQGTRLGDLEGKPHLIESYVRKFGDRESPEFLAAVQALYRSIGYDSSKWTQASTSRHGYKPNKQKAKEFLNQVKTYADDEEIL